MSSTEYKKNKKRKKSVASYSSKDYNVVLSDEVLRALEASILYAPRLLPGPYTFAMHPSVYKDLKGYRLEEQEEEYGEWYDLTQI